MKINKPVNYTPDNPSECRPTSHVTCDYCKNASVCPNRMPNDEILTKDNVIPTNAKNPFSDTEMTESMYEELKSAVWDNGVEAVDELLGYEHDVNEDADTTENRMDEALSQMPEEDALKLYQKYCKA